MTILGREAILKEIEKGNILIEPFDEERLGPASVDLHLSNAFRVFVHLPNALNMTNGELDGATLAHERVLRERIPQGGQCSSISTVQR